MQYPRILGALFQKVRAYLQMQSCSRPFVSSMRVGGLQKSADPLPPRQHWPLLHMLQMRPLPLPLQMQTMGV